MSSDSLFSQFSSTDFFFFYQQNDLHSQCESDLATILLQPKRKMYFNRQFGAGAGAFRNFPAGFMMELGVGYSIANSVAYNNTVVTDGTNGTVDRRIATSQNVISVDSDNNGNIDITVLYFLFADQKNQKGLTLNTGMLS